MCFEESLHKLHILATTVVYRYLVYLFFTKYLLAVGLWEEVAQQRKAVAQTKARGPAAIQISLDVWDRSWDIVWLV